MTPRELSAALLGADAPATIPVYTNPFLAYGTILLIKSVEMAQALGGRGPCIFVNPDWQRDNPDWFNQMTDTEFLKGCGIAETEPS